MPRATRTYETDLAELAYQIAKSDSFQRIVAEFKASNDDQQAQEHIGELLEFGRCKLIGDRGPEEWAWVLNEREFARLLSTLYRENIEG